ncbi:MAG: FAD-binding oxidoreductase [Gemmatimonadetes bacterium]|nr:FAD-binding oxidoreductase [Gemmatimonadota bacterium]
MGAALRDELVRMFSPACIRAGAEVERWAVGGAVPRAVVTPERTEQVAELLVRASAEGWSVAPAGAGTWLGAGNPPTAMDIVLSLARLEAVERYEPADLVITVGAGIPLRALDAECREHRQWLSLDPPGEGRGTLGATLATASAGPLAPFYGAARDHVLGLTLVTGDGRILELGGRVVKNVAGYDLVKLAVGSWGTLGVITSATLRLTPVPERDVTLSFFDADASALVAAARAVLEKPMDPAACTLFSPAVARMLPATAGGVGADGWLLAVRLHGNAEAVEDGRRRVEGAAERRAGGALEGESGRAFWDGVAGLEVGTPLVVRVAVLPSRAREGVALARRLLGEVGGGPGGAGAEGVVADLPAGHVRLLVRGDPGHEEVWRCWIPALAAARAEVARDGGTLTVACGPPPLVREVGAWGDPGPALRLMRELKRQFDPAGVLNPRRFVVV